MNFHRSNQFVVATAVGLALAALCKLVYDLFVGYSFVPNLLLGIGMRAPQVLLEALLVLSLLSVAFGVGTWLVKESQTPVDHFVLLAALPWVAFSLFGSASALLGEHGNTTSGPHSISASALLPSLLAMLSVPAGLWLALRRQSKSSEA